MTSSTAVLIAGAGPTGLTLACELARRRTPFRLFDLAPAPQPGSRGKGLQPRSLEVLDDLGIVDHVLANGWLAMPTRTTGPDGRVEPGAEPPPARPDARWLASLVTPQWRTERALRRCLADLGGTVEFGSALGGFEQTDDAVSAVIVRGGERELVRARWLVGCDGGHSAVRKRAGIAFDGETREEVRMVVADVAVDGLARDAWHMWRHADGFLSLCPLPSTEVFQFQAGIAPDQDPDLALANLQALVARRSGRGDIRLQAPEWASLWRANVRLAERYRAGRVLLAGDAAHIHSPAGGQGMNTGIQDAHNLGWKLAAVAQGADAALLDTYEAERRPVAQGVLALSSAMMQEAIQRRGMPERRGERTLQLAIGYRGAALARDDRGPTAALRAGDRAPDATALRTTDGEHRLFDLTRGGRFTLLAFGPAPVVPAPRWWPLRTLRVAAQACGPEDVVDTAGHLAAAFGATARSLVLIRPDGHVGFISDAGDADALSAWLAALG